MPGHALGTAGPIARLASETQKRRWLPSMVRGEGIGCIVLTEPHAGADLARVRTRARKITGGWRLDGLNDLITNGSTTPVAIILAVTGPGTRTSDCSGNIDQSIVDLVVSRTIKQ